MRYYRRKAEARLRGLAPVPETEVRYLRYEQLVRARRMLKEHEDGMTLRGIELLKHTIRARV